MQIVELIKKAGEYLAPQADALAVEVLLREVLKMSQKDLFMKLKNEVSAEEEELFWRMLEQFKAGKPVAQIIGTKEFYGLNFVINDDVLIPRPETELLVDLARQYIDERWQREPVQVLDVGTGSGCIIVSLAAVEPRVQGVGLEISEKALAVAAENASRLGVADRVEFRQSDLLGALGSMPDRKFDIILVNLPYIGMERFNFVAHDVEKYEPAVALFGGADGLDLYRKLFNQLMAMKWRPALLIGEFGFGQEEEMNKVLKQAFGSDFTIIPDLAGIPRVFVINFARVAR